MTTARMPLSYLSTEVNGVLVILKAQVAPVTAFELGRIIAHADAPLWPAMFARGVSVDQALATLVVGGHVVRTVSTESGEMVYAAAPEAA